MHYFEQSSDTGVELNLLQKYLFVSLDIYSKIKHNENRMIQLDNKLEAWLAFLCMDDPEDIAVIIEKYSEFRALYEQVYDICRNVEDVMGLFSKELAELDHNTAELMVDEMQKELDEKNEEIAGMTEIIKKQNDEITELKRQMSECQEQMKMILASKE